MNNSFNLPSETQSLYLGSALNPHMSCSDPWWALIAMTNIQKREINGEAPRSRVQMKVTWQYEI